MIKILTCFMWFEDDDQTLMLSYVFRGCWSKPLISYILYMFDDDDEALGIIAYGQGGTSVREWLPQGARFPNPPTVENKVRKINDGEWESLGKIYPRFI